MIGIENSTGADVKHSTKKTAELLDAARILNTRMVPNAVGTVLNWKGPEFDANVLATTPEMTGKNGSLALHKIHIFLGPIWNESTDSKTVNSIDLNLVAKHNEAVNIFNRIMNDGSNLSFKPMKNPLLVLKFATLGYLTDMQSSLYVMSNSREEVIEYSHVLADFFKTTGFTVLREKIEANVYGIIGIPKTAEDTIQYDKYFEYHIRVEHNTEFGDKVELTEEELNKLEEISTKFQKKFGIPVPLSFNKTTHSDRGYQGYLNVRFRDTGSLDGAGRIAEIRDAINETLSLKVIKIISKFVFYDTFPEMYQE